MRGYAAQTKTKLDLAEEMSSNLVYDTSEKLQTIGARMDNLAISPIAWLIEKTVRETKVRKCWLKQKRDMHDRSTINSLDRSLLDYLIYV